MSTQTLTQFNEFTSVQAVVSWSDILEATKIVDDEDMGAPWDEHDGWGHHLVEIEHDDERKAVGVVFTHRTAKRVVLDKPNSWGNYDYFRALGASKQVAAELTAKIHHDAKETIARWHNYGFQWFGVWCRMEVGQVQVNESLWGIQTENDSADDPYLKTVREEIARQAVGELERQGFFVIGVPEITKEPHTHAPLRCLLENKRGLNSQNFGGNMGDRGNIAILTGTGQVWFYTHWRGSEISQSVKDALALKQRWDDAPYLARIVWDKLVPSTYHGEAAGFGIDSRIGDNSHPIVVVDIPKQRVFTILEEQLSKGKIPESFEPSESKSFTEFIA